MECRKCSLANLVTKCIWLLTLVAGTYSHLHDHLELNDEFFSDNETAFGQETPEKIVLKYDDRIVIYVPRFNKCENFIAKGLNKETNITRLYNCSDCGYHKFLIHRFQSKKQYSLKLYVPHTTVSTATFVFNTSAGVLDSSPVVSHSVTSTGPGWILFRILTREKKFDQVQTFELTYMRFGSTIAYNIKQDWNERKALVFQRMSYAEDPPAVAPNIKCPQWKERNSFCVLLTEFIHPETEIGDMYSDFIFRIYTYRAIPEIADPTKLELISDSKSKAYQTVIRLWNECDTTNNKCTALDLSPQGRKRSKAKLIQVPKRPAKPSHHVLVAAQKMWPLFVAVFLLAQFVIVPWFYIHTKRRSRNAVLSYGNTVSEDKVNILENADGVQENAEPNPVERQKARRSGRRKDRKGESKPGSPSSIFH